MDNRRKTARKYQNDPKSGKLGGKKLIKGSCETTHAVVPKYHEKQYNRSGNTVLNAYPRGYALKAAFPGISGETIDKVE